VAEATGAERLKMILGSPGGKSAFAGNRRSYCRCSAKRRRRRLLRAKRPLPTKGGIAPA